MNFHSKELYRLNTWIPGKGDSKHNANSFKKETGMKNLLNAVQNQEMKIEEVETEGSNEVEFVEMVL